MSTEKHTELPDCYPISDPKPLVDLLRRRIIDLESSRKELLEALKALLACHHEGALLCSTIENAKKINEVETHAMKAVINAEQLRHE